METTKISKAGMELIKPTSVLVAPNRMAKAPANVIAIPGIVARKTSKYSSLKLRDCSLRDWIGMAFMEICLFSLNWHLNDYSIRILQIQKEREPNIARMPHPIKVGGNPKCPARATPTRGNIEGPMLVMVL